MPRDFADSVYAVLTIVVWALSVAVAVAAVAVAVVHVGSRRSGAEPPLRTPQWRCYDSSDLTDDRAEGEQEGLSDEDEFVCVHARDFKQALKAALAVTPSYP